MIVNNFTNSLRQIYFDLKKNIKEFYQNSNFYNKRISITNDLTFEYKPSPHLLSSIIKYQKKKYKIEDFALEEIWQNNLNYNEFEKLNNFYWFFSLDLKSSKKMTQTVINNWINKNDKYSKKSWDFDITSKRIISWLSNHQLTYEDCDENFKKKFNQSVQKQTNHLLNEIKNLSEVENKVIGCAAIILTGLAYKDNNKYLNNGLNLLKKIIKSSINNNGFPKSRNIKQLSHMDPNGETPNAVRRIAGKAFGGTVPDDRPPKGAGTRHLHGVRDSMPFRGALARRRCGHRRCGR